VWHTEAWDWIPQKEEPEWINGSQGSMPYLLAQEQR
jgi:hypothetical protein